MANCSICGKETFGNRFTAYNRGGRSIYTCGRCSKNRSFTPLAFSEIQGKVAKHGITAQAVIKVTCTNTAKVKYEVVKLGCKYTAVNKYTAVITTPQYARFNKLSCIRELIGMMENDGYIKAVKSAVVEYNKGDKIAVYEMDTAPMDAKYIKF